MQPSAQIRHHIIDQVIKTLCETLGFTKSKLTNVLKHFVYDGGRLGGKFIICMKSLITIFRLMVCLWFPFHSASLKHTRKKAMQVCISSIARPEYSFVAQHSYSIKVCFNLAQTTFSYIKFDITGSGQLGLTSGWLRSQQHFIHPCSNVKFFPEDKHSLNPWG